MQQYPRHGETASLIIEKEAGMEKEKCVRCGKEIEYLVSTPVMTRRYFVEGAGQLYPDSWRKLYKRKENECEKLGMNTI